LKKAPSGFSFGKLLEAEEKPMSERIPMEREAVAKLLEVLEEDPPSCGPSQRRVEELAKRLFPKKGPRSLAQRALEEARAWTMEVLEAFRRDLGIPTPTCSHPDLGRLTQEIERTLRKGWRVRAKGSRLHKELEFVVFYFSTGNECALDHHPLDRSFPLSQRGLSPSFYLTAQTGRVEVNTAGGLVARKERAFLLAQNREEVEAALAEVRNLPSLFAALGLADLGEALEALLTLERDEARVEGPYLLARRGERMILRRGGLFGAPHLDALFFEGKWVKLSFPQGVEVSLRTGKQPLAYRAMERAVAELMRLPQKEGLRWEKMTLLELKLSWEGETAHYFKGTRVWKSAADKTLLKSLLRETLMVLLDQHPRSPKMRALIAELAEAEDPLEALKDKELHRRVALRALSRL
jgi:hypothetical protein